MSASSFVVIEAMGCFIFIHTPIRYISPLGIKKRGGKPMKKLRKTSFRRTDTVEAYACRCNCSCGCACACRCATTATPNPLGVTQRNNTQGGSTSSVRTFESTTVSRRAAMGR